MSMQLTPRPGAKTHNKGKIIFRGLDGDCTENVMLEGR